MAAHRFALIVALSGACASGTQSSTSAPHAGNTQAANSQSTAQGTAPSAANQASFTVATARVVGPSNLYIPKIRVIGEQQEERLYWVDYLGNAGYLSLADGSTTTIKVNPGEFAMNSEDFFVSEEFVFAASKELSGIVVANRRGGIVRTIPTEAFVTDVTATANRVYWIDGTGLNSLSLAGDETPANLGKAQERDVLVATATHALFKERCPAFVSALRFNDGACCTRRCQGCFVARRSVHRQKWPHSSRGSLGGARANRIRIYVGRTIRAICGWRRRDLLS
tara:strand:+ start:27478 stop:28320 length:843 start_codon:yes stop_codon:yes gene_type:complete